MSGFVDGERGRFGVEPICQALDVSASAYYERARGRRFARAVEDERLLGRIRELHQANYYAYGYRRMWKALRRAGERVPRCPGAAADAGQGDRGREAARQAVAHDEAGSAGAAAARPGAARLHSLASETALVADLSYLRCWEGVVYFAFVLDAFSRMVVGWQLAAHMRTDLVLDALKRERQKVCVCGGSCVV